MTLESKATLMYEVKKIHDYLKNKISAIIKDDIDLKSPFKEVGIDSFRSIKLLKDLEVDFGRLRKTLLFEFYTIEMLSIYLIDNHCSSLFDVIGFNENQSGDSLDEEKIPQEDIAIVGLAGRYPMADNIEMFWDNLTEGRDCIRNISKKRLDLRFQSLAGQSIFGGYVEDIDKFDADFFKISAKDARSIDPQERLFLQVAWQALEDAGYYPESLIETLGNNDIGVYAGVVWSQYHMLALDNNYPSQISTQFGVANRVSYFMNFGGPSLTVNSACTSSLNALMIACDAIGSKKIGAAIVGGVNLDIHPSKQDALLVSRNFSTSGKCRSFAADADGYITGEGVGAVVLKSLAQAVKDKDNIYGVIKSVASNHTGASSGYGVPNPHAQTAVIGEALQKAGVTASSISFIEAHGTGTELGDSLEIIALTSALSKESTLSDKSCSIASVKSNIGHLEAAAGIASITKVALQLHYKKIVPSLHSSRSNDLIGTENSPFYVQQKLVEWLPNQKESINIPLRAGLNAFADGGSNIHVIFEEYRRRDRRLESKILKDKNRIHIIPFSADSYQSLNDFIAIFIVFLEKNIDIDIYDIAYTLQVGRKPMRFRTAFPANSVEDLVSKLKKYGGTEKSYDIPHGSSKNECKLKDVENYFLSGNPSKIIEFWKAGYYIKWELLYDVYQPYRISLPCYCFVKKSYWLDTNLEIDSEKNTQKTKSYIRPDEGVEEALAKIWEDVLDEDRGTIGAIESFFEIGGDSLSALSVIARIRKEFHRDLPITTLFTHSTIRTLSHALEQLPKTTLLPVIESVGSATNIPQSYAQKTLWLVDQINGGGANYNIGISSKLLGHLNVDTLRDSFCKLIQRNDIFRTSFMLDSGIPTQRITDHIEFLLPTFPAKEDQIGKLVADHFQEVFDLSEGPLISVKLFRVKPDLHMMSICIHHIICDAWSLGLMFGEISRLYRGESTNNNNDLQYKDYSVWQENFLSPKGSPSKELEVMLRYWHRSLEGANYHLPLPYDTTEVREGQERIGLAKCLLDQESTLALKHFSVKTNATLFTVLYSALSFLMSRWCKCSDVVIGTVVSGRNPIETEEMFGCFMNFLALRISVNEELSVKQFVENVSLSVLEGLRHQDCPFEKVVEYLNPITRSTRNPLYNVSLRLQNMKIEPLKLPGIVVDDAAVVMGGAQLDLMFEVIEKEDDLLLSIQYDSKLFNQNTIDFLLTEFEYILQQLPNSEALLLSEISVLRKSTLQSCDKNISKVNLAICSTFTAEPLNECLLYLSENVGLPVEVDFAPYNQIFQQMLDPTSLVSTNIDGVNVFLIRVEDWCKNNSIDGVRENILEFTNIISQSTLTIGRPCIVQFCPISINPPKGLESISKQFESTLLSLSMEISNIHVILSNDLNRYYPVTDIHNAYSGLEGHVPYTPKTYVALASLAFRKIHAISRQEYKVIVLDCDNTLWRGVCGEVGHQGVEVTPAYKKLHTIMRFQKDSGKVLCLCSKNNEEDVFAVFSNNTGMELSMDDIVLSRINWLPKSDNIISLSEELNLGLESFIFIDDDPVQCAEVRSQCPQVQTIQLPVVDSEIDFFMDHFWGLDLTGSDANRIDRTSFYKQDKQRDQVEKSALTLVDFINSLELKVQFIPLTVDYYSRASELTLRTNQFNCSGKRYRESELVEALENDNVSAFIVDVSDRYGDYGLVGLCLYQKTDSCLNADNFLLSCRAMGRGIEHAMVSYLGQLAQKNDCSSVCIEFQKSDKNEPALNFLTSLGLTDSSNSLTLPTSEAVGISYTSLVSPSPALLPAKTTKANEKNQYFTVDYQFIATHLSRVDDVLQQMSSADLVENKSLEFVAANDDVEQKLSEIWANVLKLDRVGVSDDFFEIGGNSLQAVIAIGEIYACWGVKLLIKQLFDSPTIREISELVKSALDLNDDGQNISIDTIKSKRTVIDEVDTYEL